MFTGSREHYKFMCCFFFFFTWRVNELSRFCSFTSWDVRSAACVWGRGSSAGGSAAGLRTACVQTNVQKVGLRDNFSISTGQLKIILNSRSEQHLDQRANFRWSLLKQKPWSKESFGPSKLQQACETVKSTPPSRQDVNIVTFCSFMQLKSLDVTLQNSARLLVLEGVFWGGDAHQQRVVLSMLSTVTHQVWRRLGHLQTNQMHKSETEKCAIRSPQQMKTHFYPFDAGLHPQLLHRPPGLSRSAGALHSGCHLNSHTALLKPERKNYTSWVELKDLHLCGWRK